MWRQSANHSHSLRWEQKTAPWEFQTKLLDYFFLSNNKSNLHFTGGYGYRGTVAAGEGSNQEWGEIGAGYVNLKEKRKGSTGKRRGRIQLELFSGWTSGLFLGVTQHPCDKAHALLVLVTTKRCWRMWKDGWMKVEKRRLGHPKDAMKKSHSERPWTSRLQDPSYSLLQFARHFNLDCWLRALAILIVDFGS